MKGEVNVEKGGQRPPWWKTYKLGWSQTVHARRGSECHPGISRPCSARQILHGAVMTEEHANNSHASIQAINGYVSPRRLRRPLSEEANGHNFAP
jgi:hypothetical protein